MTRFVFFFLLCNRIVVNYNYQCALCLTFFPFKKQLGKIQASAKKHLVPKIRENVQEGSTYEIENVLVTKNDRKYQVTQHRFKLNLIDKTKFFKIDASIIPLNHFDFVPFNEILEAEREEKIVGEFKMLVYDIKHIVITSDINDVLFLCSSISFFIDITPYHKPLCADVIGQVVERDELKEKDVNGRRSKLIDLTLQDSEYVV